MPEKVKWVKAKCPVCGREYEYAEAVYEPLTWGQAWGDARATVGPVPRHSTKNT